MKKMRTACAEVINYSYVYALGYTYFWHDGTLKMCCLHSTVLFFNTIFVSSHMYPENSEGTQVIVGSMNIGYISYTARNHTHNVFRPKREPISLGHNDGFTRFSMMHNLLSWT